MDDLPSILAPETPSAPVKAKESKWTKQLKSAQKVLASNPTNLDALLNEGEALHNIQLADKKISAPEKKRNEKALKNIANKRKTLDKA